MSQTRTCIFSSTVGSSRTDAIVETLMIALVVFAPLALGVSEARRDLVVVALASAMALCLSLKIAIKSDAGFVWFWAYVPAGLFLLLVVLQLSPLPVGLLRLISPNAVKVKMQLLSDLPNAGETMETMRPTFYPLATARGFRLLLAAAMIFLSVTNVFRRPEQIKRLLGAMVIVGAIGAIFGLVKCSFANPSGFLNQIRYSQYMNLSIGAGLGLLLVKLKENSHRGRRIVAGIRARLARPELRIVWCLTGAVILGVGMILSLRSRGAVIAMLVAGGFTAMMLAAGRISKRRGWITALLALAVFVCALLIGLDAMRDRWTSQRSPRNDIVPVQSVNQLFSPLSRLSAIGTGLGTHNITYGIFRQSMPLATGRPVENHYVRLMQETGVVGLMLLVILLGIIWFSYIRSVRRIRLPIQFAAFGLGFGLLAIMICGFGDAGRISFPVLCMAAGFAGLLVSLVQTGRPGSKTRRRKVSKASCIPLRVLFMLGIAALSAWSVFSSVSACYAETHWVKALRISNRLRRDDWRIAKEDYIRLFSHASLAVSLQPDNVLYRTRWNVWRWRSISHVSDARLDELVRTPQILSIARKIAADLHKVRASCPTYGPAYSAAGQLEAFILEEPAGERHIRTGFALAPHDASVCFTAGLLDVREGRIDASVPKFRHSLQLDKGLIRNIVDVYVRQVNRPDLAVAVASGNIGWLLRVAAVLDGRACHGDATASRVEYSDFAAEARREALFLLKKKCEQPGAAAWGFACIAKLHSKNQEYDPAIEYYRRALALEYAQVHWRVSLASALARTGRLSEAMHEARVCLRFQPEMRAARNLITELSLLSNASERK